MREHNNKIIEATEEEIFSLWLKREMDDIMSFPDYLKAFEEAGCKIKAD